MNTPEHSAPTPPATRPDATAGAPASDLVHRGPVPETFLRPSPKPEAVPPSGPAEETKGGENKGVEPFSIREGIREGMERKGWSQSDLASHLNVSRQYVSRILDDAIPEPNWTLDHLREIATALDLNLTVFLSTKS